jgi:hypothetical protein
MFRDSSFDPNWISEIRPQAGQQNGLTVLIDMKPKQDELMSTVTKGGGRDMNNMIKKYFGEIELQFTVISRVVLLNYVPSDSRFIIDI